MTKKWYGPTLASCMLLVKFTNNMDISNENCSEKSIRIIRLAREFGGALASGTQQTGQADD